MFDNIKKEVEKKLNERAVPTKGFTGYIMWWFFIAWMN